MTVSSISGITLEGQPQELSSFLRPGRSFASVTTTAGSLGFITDNVGTTFTSQDVGRRFTVNSGADAGTYLISVIVSTSVIRVTTTAGAAVSFTGAAAVTGTIPLGAYVLWHSPISPFLKRLNWKPHDYADYTEVTPALGLAFRSIAALYDPTSDQVVVVWDDGTAVANSTSGVLFVARFNPANGALMSGPTSIGPGSDPKLAYRSTVQDSNWMLYYRTAKNGGVYGRVSRDGGLTWQSGYPLVTGQVSATAKLDVISYSSSHASIAQLGRESRQLKEISAFQRSRPLTSIVKHPAAANQFFIGEPSKFDNVTLTDNLRGGLVLATDNSKLYHLDGVVQGVSDSVGAVALVSVAGTVMSVTASAGPTGNGDDINSYTLVPASGALNVDLPNASCAVSLDVSSAYGYIAEYTDNGTLGQFIVVDLTSGSTGTVLSGLTGVRAVAVANFLAVPLIFVATTESGVERLRVYQENALTPTLLLNTKLTSRANALSVAPDPLNANGVLVYASLVDRLNVYEYVSSSAPVQLRDSLTLPGGGSFFQSRVASGGNIVVAAGNAGVLVLDPSGKILAQTPVSGESIPEWKPSTVYALNALVRPREIHQFARSRYYFKASTGGTSGNSEPLWAATGTVIDNSAQWQAVGLIDGVAVGLELDEDNERVLVAGSAGGNLGTDGRVWLVSAGGLVRNRGHVLDANTLALWRFDNLGGTVESDISGNGYALTSLHDSTSILGNVRYGRHLTGNTGTGLWSAPAPSAITPLHGEYTVEAWVRTNALTNGPLLTFRVASGISYPTQDPLVEFDIGSTGLQMVLYYSSGPLYNVCSVPGVISIGAWTHVAGRKRLNGAGPNYDMHIFVNGVRVAQTLNVPGPAVGDGNDVNGAWAVGSTYPDPGTGFFPAFTNVDVDDMRVSKVARSDAEILASYNRGAV